MLYNKFSAINEMWCDFTTSAAILVVIFIIK